MPRRTTIDNGGATSRTTFVGRARNAAFDAWLTVLPVVSRASGRTQPAVYARRTPEQTPLYAVARDELETYLACAHERERVLPCNVPRELRAYLQCGLRRHAFVRARCVECGLDRLVAFSCKGRGFCPACVGRRTAAAAAHLVDRVLPQAPVRQWVLSLPHSLRYLRWTPIVGPLVGHSKVEACSVNSTPPRFGTAPRRAHVPAGAWRVSVTASVPTTSSRREANAAP